MASEEEEKMMVAKNRRMILKEYVEGYPREEHMELVPAGDIALKVPESEEEPGGSVLVKNLYLSCDPYMRLKMSRPLHKSYTDAFVPGSVITGYGVARVVDSCQDLGFQFVSCVHCRCSIVKLRNEVGA